MSEEIEQNVGYDYSSDVTNHGEEIEEAVEEAVEEIPDGEEIEEAVEEIPDGEEIEEAVEEIPADSMDEDSQIPEGENVEGWAGEDCDEDVVDPPIEDELNSFMEEDKLAPLTLEERQAEIAVTSEAFNTARAEGKSLAECAAISIQAGAELRAEHLVNRRRRYAEYPKETTVKKERVKKEKVKKEKVNHDNGNLLHAGIGETYSSSDEFFGAMMVGMVSPTTATPTQYRKFLALSFLKGRAKGQIQAIYNDLKNYGFGAVEKAADFFAKYYVYIPEAVKLSKGEEVVEVSDGEGGVVEMPIAANPNVVKHFKEFPADAEIYEKYSSMVESGIAPEMAAALVEGKVDQLYVKYYMICRMVESMSEAAAIDSTIIDCKAASLSKDISKFDGLLGFGSEIFADCTESRNIAAVIAIKSVIALNEVLAKPEYAGVCSKAAEGFVDNSVPVVEMSWRRAIVTAMHDHGCPMNSSEITDIIVEKKYRLNIGTTPEATVGSQIAVSLSKLGDASPYVRESKGTFSLKPGAYEAEIATESKKGRKAAVKEAEVDAATTDGVESV